MINFLRAKPSSLLVATIFAISAVSMAGCSNSNETKAVDRLEEAEALAAPLLDTLQRLTYEVTEIALDRPGINLEF